MSHFAKIENGTVTEVIVAEQDFIDTLEGTWVQTSYNTRAGVHYGSDGQPDQGVALRKNYPSVGWNYSRESDAFYPPQPFPSWTLDTATAIWHPPTPKPEGYYKWNESTLKWEKFNVVA